VEVNVTKLVVAINHTNIADFLTFTLYFTVLKEILAARFLNEKFNSPTRGGQIVHFGSH
jgi:hypothetical protein